MKQASKLTNSTSVYNVTAVILITAFVAMTSLMSYQNASARTLPTITVEAQR